MAFINSYAAGTSRGSANSDVPPGYVYVPGLGVVPVGSLGWNVPDSGYSPFAYQGDAGFDEFGMPAGLQQFQFAADDWGVPDQGFDAPGTAYQYEDARTMHPYAGVEVQQTMPPEYHAAHPEYYSAEAAAAWSRAHMTPDEIEAERMRLLEEQYGSLSFWRTIGRALLQGVSLGWGDEAIARYESWRRGTSYEEEWQRQMAINNALASVDPVAWATGEFAGSAAWNALGPTATGLAALRNAGLIGAATSGLSLMGASPSHTDDLERLALGAISGGPLATVARGFTFARRPPRGQFVIDSAFQTAPTLAFQAQIPGQLPMVQY